MKKYLLSYTNLRLRAKKVFTVTLLLMVSEIFALGSPQCASVLDFHGGNKIDRQVGYETVTRFVSGYLIGFHRGEGFVSDKLWGLSNSAYYRLVIQRCDESPEKNLDEIVQELIISIN